MSNTQTFIGDGETRTFYFTIPFFGVNDIHVSINNIELTSADFALYPTGPAEDADVPYSGGHIDFPTAPLATSVIKIYRNIELLRHIDYQPTEQPLAHQLNQDANQCMEALKELAEKITNILGLANIPTVADLLSELSTIREQLPEFLTTNDLNDINTTIATKANKDIDNITSTGKINIASCAVPDYNASISIKTYSSASNKFIAPQNGVVYGDTANNATLYMNDVAIKGASSTGYGGVSFCFPIAAGDSFYGGFANIAHFAPFKNA